MNIKEKIVKALFGDFIRTEIEKSSKQIVTYISGKEEQIIPEIDFDVFEQMYEQTSWLRAVVSVICKAVTARGYTLIPTKSGADPKNAEILNEFFSNCNPNDTFLEILDDITRDVYVFGNGFIEVVYDAHGRPKELWNLDATNMSIKADEHGAILGYIQQPKYSSSQKIEFEPKEVIHFKLGTKGSTLYGLSPLASLILPVTVDKYAQIYNRSFFLNGAKIRGAFIMKNATPEQVERNREYMKERARTPDMAHSDLVLEGDIEFKQISSTQKDMEFLELREFTRNEILAVYGVPPSKVSIIETGNIGAGTGEHQTQTFYEETILPFQMRVAEKITKHIIRQGFGINDWSFQFAKRSIDEKEQAEIFSIYLQNGVLTPQEVRNIISPRIPELQKSAQKDIVLIQKFYDKDISNIDNKFARELKKLLERLFEKIKAKLPSIKTGRTVDVIAEVIKKDDFRNLFDKYLSESAKKGFESSVKNNELKDVESISQSVRDKIKQRADEIAEEFSSAILNKLKEELMKGLRANETIPQLSKRIENWLGSQTITVKPVLDEQGNIIREGTTRTLDRETLSEIIARSESNRFFNEGNLDALKQAEVDKVQWLLAVDACDKCVEAAEAEPGQKLGKILDIDEADDILPLHPNCRCTFIKPIEKE